MDRKPKVFVGSSTEQLELAREIQIRLHEHGAEVTVWQDGVFDIAKTTWHNLEKALSAAHFGIFIMGPDDIVFTRKKNFNAPRDNVVFELGFFAGKLGLHRTFIVRPKESNLKLPSDLLGITAAEFDAYQAKRDPAGAVGPACTRIYKTISKIFGETVDMSWDELFDSVDRLGKKFRPPDFVPDILVGIPPGGIIVADLLSMSFAGVIPLISLWGDRCLPSEPITFDHTVNKPVKELLSSGDYRKPLIVDNISKTGMTLIKAKEFVSSCAKNSNVKTAVLVAVEDAAEAPDYYIQKTQYSDFRMPDMT